MAFRKYWFGGMAVLLAGSALADEDIKMKMGIVVAESDGTGIQSFKIDSDDIEFDLQEMQVGESRSIVDESGRTVLITRREDGFSFNVDGKAIDFPASASDGQHGMVWVGDATATDVHDVDKTMIISGKPIDLATQQAIRDLLSASGYSSDVRFIDRDTAHGKAVTIHRIETASRNPEL